MAEESSSLNTGDTDRNRDLETPEEEKVIEVTIWKNEWPCVRRFAGKLINDINTIGIKFEEWNYNAKDEYKEKSSQYQRKLKEEFDVVVSRARETPFAISTGIGIMTVC